MQKKILLIRFSSIGDIIITTPIIKSLREKYPQAQIDYLTKKRFACLLEQNPALNRVLAFDGDKKDLWTLKKELKAQQYDFVVDLHNSLRSRFLRFCLSGKVFVYKKPYFRRWLLCKFGINFLQKAKPIFQRYYAACESLKLLEHTEYFTYFSSEDFDKTKKFGKSKPILLSLSAAHFTKKWSVEKFAKLIARLPNENIVILGGEQEFAEAKELLKKCPNATNVENLCGKLNLLQTAALMSQAKLLVCHDSGLLHLAQSQSLPCVSIFGCTSKELGFFPIKENCRVVQVDLRCRPCTAKGLPHCPQKHFRCMQEITVEMVMKEVKKFL